MADNLFSALSTGAQFRYTVKVTIPELTLDEEDLLNAIAVEIDRRMDASKVMFRKTHATWDNSLPLNQDAEVGKPVKWYKDFRGLVGAGRTAAASPIGFLEGRLYTTSKKYLFVNSGTRQRMVTMSKNFLPKTRPRVLDSSAGRGKATGFANLFLEGIEPREFADEIAKIQQPIFTRNIGILVQRLSARAWSNTSK